MPTRYWLVGSDETYAVAVLEANGGVRRAELEVDEDLITAAHDRHQISRASRIPEDHEGPVPSGGIGGTRRVKCLHAHYACFLAGEDDPVGKWVHHQLGFGLCRLERNDPETTVMIEGTTFSIPTQISAINERLSMAHTPTLLNSPTSSARLPMHSTMLYELMMLAAHTTLTLPSPGHTDRGSHGERIRNLRARVNRSRYRRRTVPPARNRQRHRPRRPPRTSPNRWRSSRSRVRRGRSRAAP